MKFMSGKNAWLALAVISVAHLTSSAPVTDVVPRVNLPHPEPIPDPIHPDPIHPDPVHPGEPGHPGEPVTQPQPNSGHPGSPPPAALNPGDFGVGGGVGDVRPMKDYQGFGTQRYNAYEDVRKNPSAHPDTTIIDDATKTGKDGPFFDMTKNKDYSIQQDALFVKTDFPELGAFTDDELGFQLSRAGLGTRVTVRPTLANGQPDLSNTINQGVYDRRGNYFLAENAFKNNDKSKTAGEKVPPHELGFQSFQEVAAGNTNNLRAIFLMNIQNKGFWSIAAQNYHEINKAPTEKVTWTRGTTAEEQARFDRFLGSPNINGKILALTNHHGALGGRDISKIITVPKQAPNSKGKFTVVLVLA